MYQMNKCIDSLDEAVNFHSFIPTLISGKNINDRDRYKTKFRLHNGFSIFSRLTFR